MVSSYLIATNIHVEKDIAKQFNEWIEPLSNKQPYDMHCRILFIMTPFIFLLVDMT